jgi:Zn-dependent protease
MLLACGQHVDKWWASAGVSRPERVRARDLAGHSFGSPVRWAEPWQFRGRATILPPVFDPARIVLNLIPMALSLSVHEFAHALAADRLGDRTPRAQGRLTLSPLAHYDLFGTIIVPAVATLLSGFALIGWAKPVQFVPANLTRKISMRNGAALVAMAGPLSNLFLAFLAAAGLAAVYAWLPAESRGTALAELLQAMFFINIGLCVFNLLPLPPLDGSHLLPRSFDELKASIAPYSFIIILILLNIAPVRHVLFDFPVFFLGSFLSSLFDLPEVSG